MNALTQNLDKIHTTQMGVERIRRNLGLQTDDVVAWCKDAVKNADIMLLEKAKTYKRMNKAAVIRHVDSIRKLDDAKQR